MNYLITSLILLAVVVVALTARVIINRRELKRLERNGYRKLASKYRARGSVNADCLRMLAECSLLILMLAAVFGWLAHASPR